MKKLFHLTKEGVKELGQELEKLTAMRPDLAERIKSAREFGDLAENAEYTSARAEQEKVETRIGEIEHILQNVDVIKKPKAGGKVGLGSTVTLKAGGKSKQFQVVGTVEADPLNGKISDESPIGKALMNKKVGDDVEIVTPAETATYQVTEIS